MATISVSAATGVDFRTLDVTLLIRGAVLVASATSTMIDYGGGNRDVLTGRDFTYDSQSHLTGGTLNGYANYAADLLVANVSGMSGSVASFMTFVQASDTPGALGYLLSGDDMVRGGAGNDYLIGYGGNNTISGGAGDDTIAASVGNDQIDGGSGTNVVVFAAPLSNYKLTAQANGLAVADQRAGAPDGTDLLSNIQRLTFTDRTVDLTLGDPATDTAAHNILRFTTPFVGSALVANGLAGGSAGVQLVLTAAGATTSVATLTYEFFTGKAPSAPGMDYLVSPTGPNPNNLNSAYFQSFNVENRYINFAVNLGNAGDGRAAFQTTYGSLSLFDATKLTYAKIFGDMPSDTKVHALLDPSVMAGGQTITRADYFAIYGGDGPNGLGTKAAMVGYLLAEAVKADLGTYAKSNDAFLTDVGLHGAAYGVDLVGVYGQLGFVFHPG